MATKRKKSKKRGPKEERLKIEEEPEKALRKLFQAKPDKSDRPTEKRPRK